MASGEKQPPDKAARRYYKCHPKKQVPTVIFYCMKVHITEVTEKIPEHKYVGDNLIICPEHILNDITSEVNDIELNDVAKKVIAIIKLKQTEEIRKALLQEIQNKTIEKHNLTVARVPKITIKTKDPEQTLDLLKNCTNCLIAEKSIQTRFVCKKNDSEIEISCMNSTSVEAAEMVLNSNLNNCEIKIEQQGNPKIKIVGINNTTSMKRKKSKRI